MEDLKTKSEKRFIYKVAKLNELMQEEVYDMCKARFEVFVCEQKITCENDFDDKDKDCYHLFAYEGIGEEVELAGYCRLLAPGVSYEEASIGRVLVLPKYRGIKLGTKMMEQAVVAIKEMYGADKVTLSAQSYVKKMYELAGFKQVSDEYDEAGIPHVKMKYSNN